jgi:hypothetical protein
VGGTMITLGVTDLDDILARLAQHGIELMQIPRSERPEQRSTRTAESVACTFTGREGQILGTNPRRPPGPHFPFTGGDLPSIAMTDHPLDLKFAWFRAIRGTATAGKSPQWMGSAARRMGSRRLACCLAGLWCPVD